MKNNNRFKCTKYYDNLISNKQIIYSDNKGKSGIYRLINKVTNNSYIGSSNNIGTRLKTYFSIACMKNTLSRSNSCIYKAILEYGISNFELEILELCNKENLIEKEQYYLNLLKPKYNKLKIIKNTKCPVQVINKKTGYIESFSSLRKAAIYLNISHVGLLDYINTNKIFKNIYIITKIGYYVNDFQTIFLWNNENTTIKVYDYFNNSIKEFHSKRNVGEYLGRLYSTIISAKQISSYIHSNKLYKNRHRIFI